MSTGTGILKIQPGDVTIAAGQQLEVVVDLAGTIPKSVRVEYTTVDSTYVDEREM